MGHDEINQMKKLQKYRKVSNDGPSKCMDIWQHFISTMDENRSFFYRKQPLNEKNTTTSVCHDSKTKKHLGGI